MGVPVQIFTPPATTLGVESDLLFWSMMALTLTVAITITLVAIYFMVKYRRGSPADRSHPPRRKRVIEYTWALVPLGLFIVIFVWAASLYVRMFYPPKDSMEIYVIGKQWMWKIQHPDGRREINELHIPVNRDIKVTLTSEDVIHSFFVPAFRLKRDVVPGRYTTLWFKTNRVGAYHIFCAQYCGTAHADMRGMVYVMTPTAYQKWLERGAPRESLVARGARRFRELGCTGCHGPSATVHAPDLAGLYGRPVPLSDGSVVIADEKYIRDSIMLPLSQIAAGYPPIMPSFATHVSEGDILALIEYIKQLKPNSQLRESPP